MASFFPEIDPLWKNCFLFPLGFYILIRGAHLFIDGCASMAKKINVSQLVIGLTIVALGTSAPEFVINVVASLGGSPGLAFGNVIGSNIANVLLVLGVSAIILPLKIQKGTLKWEIPFSIFIIILLWILISDTAFGRGSQDMITRIDGLILILFFSVFIFYTFKISKHDVQEDVMIKDMTNIKIILYIVLGILGLSLGGKWIFDGAIFFARKFEISEVLIGITIVAIGTSLPELAASSIAAYKKNSDISVGNIVGSNIFNILWVLGASATIHPIKVGTGNDLNILMLFFSSLALFLFIILNKKTELNKVHGIIFIVTYFIYLLYLVISA